MTDNESAANMLDDDDPNPPRCASCGVALREHLGLYGTCAEVREAKAELAFFASLGYTIRKDERGRRYVNSAHGRHYQLREQGE